MKRRSLRVVPHYPTGTDEQRGQGPPGLHDADYEAVRHPYVPAWLPWRLHRQFMARFHAAVKRALARRGGRWRNHQDEVRIRWHILGGLTSALKGGRASSGWGRRMRAKKAQKALQSKLANEGEMLVDYFARIGQRGGLAKARNRRESVMRALPPEQRLIYENQQAVLSGQHRPTRAKSWLEL